MTPQRLAAVLITLIACGSNNGPITNLKPVFFRTVSNAPVASFTLKRQNGAAMTQAKVSIDTRQLFDGWITVGRTTTAQANSSGVAAAALTAGTYPVSVSPNVSPADGLVGGLRDSLSISQDTAKTYQTSQQNWTVTSPKPFSALEIDVYQVDGNGRAMVGTKTAPINGLVLVARPAVPGQNASSVTFATELFQGSYRAVITATPVTSTDSIAPFETAAFNAAGGGATETQSVALGAGGNVVSLQFMEAGAPVPDSQIGSVLAYDADSYLFLGAADAKNGVATVVTGAVGNVFAMVESPDGATLATGQYAASPTHSATLTRYTVSGHARLPTGAPLTQSNNNSYGTVAATLQASFGGFPSGGFEPFSADISDALGTYQIKLFAGSWSLQAVHLNALPASATVPLNVGADATQDIALAQGGVISGNLQDQAHNNLSGVEVDVYDGSHLRVGSAQTNASGNYSIPVQNGSYEVIAGGALTQNVAVSSAASTKTLNLTRFQVNGRLTDPTQGAVAGKVFWGGGSATATTLGTYTVDVFEGLNWFLFTAPSTSPGLGFAYQTDVLVNADTLKSLQ